MDSQQGKQNPFPTTPVYVPSSDTPANSAPPYQSPSHQSTMYSQGNDSLMVKHPQPSSTPSQQETPFQGPPGQPPSQTSTWQPQMQGQPDDFYHQSTQPPPRDQTWQRSFFKWPGCGDFWESICIPFYGYGKTEWRLRDPTMTNYDDNNEDCLTMAWMHCSGLGWIQVAQQRGELRRRFGIDGSGLDDCCKSFWCQCYASLQQDHEVEARLGPGAWPGAGPDLQGYQANMQGMSMQPMPQGPPQAQHQSWGQGQHGGQPWPQQQGKM